MSMDLALTRLTYLPITGTRFKNCDLYVLIPSIDILAHLRALGKFFLRAVIVIIII